MLCATCGNALPPAAQRCGRCGAGLPAAAIPAGSDGENRAPDPAPGAVDQLAVTVDRSRLPAVKPAPPESDGSSVAGAAEPAVSEPAAIDPPEPDPAATPVVVAAGPVGVAGGAVPATGAPLPPLVLQPPGTLRSGPAGRPPVEVAVVSGAMLLLAALLAYPVVRYGFPLVPSLVASSAFERAIAALFLYALVIVAACATALVALAVGMLRGSRVCQILTALLAGAIAIAVLINGQTSAGGAQAHNTATVIIVLVCLATIALIALPRSARGFFAQDESPVGVVATATACVYFGWCICVAGLVLMIAGSIASKFVWWGALFVLLGAGLTALSRPLRAGRGWARNLATLGLAGYVVASLIFAGTSGDTGATGTVIQAAIGAGAVGLLWLLPSSSRHFAAGPHPIAPRLAVQPVGWLALGVLTVVLAGIGLSAGNSTAASSIDTYTPPTTYNQPLLTESPTASTGPIVRAGSLTNVWTVPETGPGGYTETVTLSAGAPQHLQPGLEQGQLIAGSACSIDSSTDGVIPAELQESNTTDGFATYTGAAFTFGNQWNSPAVEVRYSDGPQCETDGYNDHSTDKLQPGMRSAVDMFFVLHGYYTPDHPDGDPAVLAAATVTFNLATVNPDDGSSPIQYTPATATGAPTDSDGSIPLGGSSAGDPSSGADDSASPSESPSASQDDLTQQVGPVDDGDCVGHTTGQLSAYLAHAGCTDLKRSLYTMTIDGRPAVIAVADLFLVNQTDVTPFAELSTRNGTGDVLTLIHDGDNFTDGPASFSHDPTYLAQAGSAAGEVVVLQAMWNDGAPTHADDPALAPALSQLLSVVQ